MSHKEDLSESEISAMFADPCNTEQFPPILTVDQAAELLQVPKNTIYDWNSRGLLKSCSRRVGRHLRIIRDRLIDHIFNKGLQPND